MEQAPDYETGTDEAWAEQEQALICPIRMHAIEVKPGAIPAKWTYQTHPAQVECLKEKCAWWDHWSDRHSYCAIRSIPEVLGLALDI